MGSSPPLSAAVWLEVPLAVLLLDYTLYLWHVLMHRLTWLWRFHLPHHVDLDLDASTALRFHFSELVVSVVWRAGQVTLIGVSPLSLSVWQTLLMLRSALSQSLRFDRDPHVGMMKQPALLSSRTFL
ncbi:MAG: hypothetical protein GEU77_08020 [Deltaproteobacteria bacterium]|nr:hypothetical protein [Deltaproteobacteria bacterium]